ncbi:nuclear transport factor 2 family protein [Ketobacter sp. MCCC 1A13808]|uniref:nuclear transport factor 2 family protein n=1 Tax=Ketobacter sp. MCCC 1A13808 TaxID=2602738 RepID=UPI0012EBB213|nr:nuclear transport factor 2 family protein [Ketobacter sp. MCCC 1A13808]MVF14958.1 nuclear transport factor 2 family protein [Ketobacter sp. MCCC 1A13808]
MTPQNLMQEYEKALASQKWSRVEPLLHNDVCVTFFTGTFKGKEEVHKAFENNFATIKDEKYSISNIHWACLDSVTAVCLYSFKWQGIINGQAASGGGRGTSVLINSGGTWQIITEHLGPNAS